MCGRRKAFTIRASACDPGCMMPTGRNPIPEFPPDPPEPFDESTVVEFSFQFYATHIEAERHAADLRSAVAPLLDEVGRHHTRIAMTSVRSGQFDAVHSSSSRRRKPGQHLFDISIAVRGRGDRSTLGDNVFDAVTGAKLDFEQMSETPYSGAYLQDALNRYPSLGTA